LDYEPSDKAEDEPTDEVDDISSITQSLHESVREAKSFADDFEQKLKEMFSQDVPLFEELILIKNQQDDYFKNFNHNFKLRQNESKH
jgi:hypothetical protein